MVAVWHWHKSFDWCSDVGALAVNDLLISHLEQLLSRPKYLRIKASHVLLLNEGSYLYSARMNSEVLSQVEQFSLIRFEAMKKLCPHRTC